MRYWSYLIPKLNGKHERKVVSEDEILKTYGPTWGFLAGRQVGKILTPGDITPENCIRDFVHIHMAREVKPHNWSGWPGAFCLDCGCEDPLEIALADNKEDEVELDIKNNPEKYSCKATTKVPYGNDSQSGVRVSHVRTEHTEVGQGLQGDLFSPDSGHFIESDTEGPDGFIWSGT